MQYVLELYGRTICVLSTFVSFSVDAKAVWLRDDETNRAYIPDIRNCFNLQHERFSVVPTLMWVIWIIILTLQAAALLLLSITLSATSHHGPGFRYECTTCIPNCLLALL